MVVMITCSAMGWVREEREDECKPRRRGLRGEGSEGEREEKGLNEQRHEYRRPKR